MPDHGIFCCQGFPALPGLPIHGSMYRSWGPPLERRSPAAQICKQGDDRAMYDRTPAASRLQRTGIGRSRKDAVIVGHVTTETREYRSSLLHETCWSRKDRRSRWSATLRSMAFELGNSTNTFVHRLLTANGRTQCSPHTRSSSPGGSTPSAP